MNFNIINYFLWKIFFKKYYIPAVLQYTKPIKTNFINHEDISALIDPYIQSYLEFLKDFQFEYNSKREKEFLNYCLFKTFTNIRKNKYLNPVYVDICSYFSSKSRKLVEKSDLINNLYNNLIDFTKNKNVNDDNLSNVLVQFLTEIDIKSSELKSVALSLIKDFKTNIDVFKSRIVNFKEGYYNKLHDLFWSVGSSLFFIENIVVKEVLEVLDKMKV